jgi:hypothetical protein
VGFTEYGPIYIPNRHKLRAFLRVTSISLSIKVETLAFSLSLFCDKPIFHEFLSTLALYDRSMWYIGCRIFFWNKKGIKPIGPVPPPDAILLELGSGITNLLIYKKEINKLANRIQEK